MDLARVNFADADLREAAFADRLHADLKSRGVRCWLASEDLKIGDRFRQRIDDSIRTPIAPHSRD